jgi:6,7-dimethyl-8-ribityllumazine synthase
MSQYQATLKNIDSLDRSVHIALVVSEFNYPYTEALERLNRTYLNELWFLNVETYWVPGAFEIPWFIRRLRSRNDYDLILTLGVVIRGDTPHFEYVCGETARGIMDLTLEDKAWAIIFWVLTCENDEQVRERLGHSASLAGLNLLTELSRI